MKQSFSLQLVIFSMLSFPIFAHEGIQPGQIVSHALRETGGYPSDYEIDLRYIDSIKNENLYGLTSEHIIKIKRQIKHYPVWLVILRLVPNTGVRGWSHVYVFSAESGDLIVHDLY